MHKNFPFQCIFSMSLPTFRKGVRCTTALHPLTRAVQCVVCLSTLKAKQFGHLPPFHGVFVRPFLIRISICAEDNVTPVRTSIVVHYGDL